MFEALRRWREQKVLRSSALPDALWREALEALPFLAIYTEAELLRLRDRTVLFLHAKGIIGAAGHVVTPLARTIIAVQACVPLLNLDFRLYDTFENVIVYPGEFIPGWEWEDEYGVVHRNDHPLAGEAMPGGPVILSWPDVEASADWEATGMSLVIHEFAHKLDMRNGEANGCPPLSRDMRPAEWKRVLRHAFLHFHARVERGDETAIDPYAAESPAEFFAVLSEVFFADPTLLLQEYSDVYAQFARFYRQDPAARTELLLDS